MKLNNYLICFRFNGVRGDERNHGRRSRVRGAAPRCRIRQGRDDSLIRPSVPKLCAKPSQRRARTTKHVRALMIWLASRLDGGV